MEKLYLPQFPSSLTLIKLYVPIIKKPIHSHTRSTMSPTYSKISGVVACTCVRKNSTAALNMSSTFSMIPQTVHFGKYHITTFLPKLQPFSDTVWRKKSGFDKLKSTIYGLLKSHSVADLILLIARKVPIETFTAQQEAIKVMYKV